MRRAALETLEIGHLKTVDAMQMPTFFVERIAMLTEATRVAQAGSSNVNLDVVCAASPKLAGDYRNEDANVVTDQKITNVGRWRHAVREYLARDEVRKRLKDLLEI